MIGSPSPYISINLARFLALSISNPAYFCNSIQIREEETNQFIKVQNPPNEHTYVFSSKSYGLVGVFLGSLSFET